MHWIGPNRKPLKQLPFATQRFFLVFSCLGPIEGSGSCCGRDGQYIYSYKLNFSFYLHWFSLPFWYVFIYGKFHFDFFSNFLRSHFLAESAVCTPWDGQWLRYQLNGQSITLAKTCSPFRKKTRFSSAPRASLLYPPFSNTLNTNWCLYDND